MSGNTILSATIASLSTLAAINLFGGVVSGAESPGEPQDPALAAQVELIDDIMSRYHAAGQFQGAVLVAMDGRVIYRKAFGRANVEWDIPNTPDTKFRIASHGKMFTAAIIMQLAEEGRGDLDAPISTYLPSIEASWAGGITVHQVLNHSSGLPLALPAWEATNYRDPFTLAQNVELAKDLELIFKSGTQFGYSNIGFNLLGAVVEQATGQTYEQVLMERVLDPLDMTDTGFVRHATIVPRQASNYNRLPWGEFVNAPYHDESFAIGAGGLYSTVDDMLRWQEALFGDDFLTAESRARMFTRGHGNSGYGCAVGGYVTAESSIPNTLVLAKGGTSGASSVSFRLVENHTSFIALGNISEIPQDRLASNITNAVLDVPVNPINPPAINAYARRLLEECAKELVEEYRRARESGGNAPTESAINSLGYQLFGMNRFEEAVRVFRFNVAAYPDSWNAHDSLGEGLLAMDEREQAIESYHRSVELNPDNTNGRAVLDRLGVTPPE